MENLIGKRFNKLTVIEYVGVDKHHNRLWKCKCSCGNYTIIRGHAMKKGLAKSCGCWRKENASKLFKTHGLRSHPLYVVWVDMRHRCDKNTDARYSDYGGRGISVCKEWYDFKTFYDWAINSGYEQNLTIDRIDNDGNYEPSNCRWVDRFVQGNNKRNNRPICIDGETKNLFEWCRKYNINPTTVISRIKRGWSEKDAITKPPRPIKNKL